MHPHIPALVRARDDADLVQLQNAGATDVIPELIEGSLILASHILLIMGMPAEKVEERINGARKERYSLFRDYFGADEEEEPPAEFKPD